MKIKILMATAAVFALAGWAGAALYPKDITEAVSAGTLIQFQGRVKSLDVFSREMTQSISTRTRWNRKPAHALILDGISGRANLLETAFVRLDYPKLKQMMGADTQDKYFSYLQLKPGFSTLTWLVDSARAKSDAGAKTTKIEQKANELYQRLVAVDLLYSGDILRVIPPGGGEGEAWTSPFHHGGARGEKFLAFLEHYRSGDVHRWAPAAEEWNAAVHAAVGPAVYRQVRLENYYYRLAPFHMTWICYLLAFILLMSWKGDLGRFSALVLIWAGLAGHTLGLALRTVILARPPVSNMYESMIFMDWVLIISALVFYLLRKNLFFLSTGTLVSAMVMIYADLLPVDKTLGVLMPVLRSNYWLLVHVLTIVASYGIFGLCMAVGHRHLFFLLSGRMDKNQARESSKALLYMMQAGLILLGAGTILGGVWANESWGRFWGWDPKETWSLITFVGYLTVIHLWYGGKINNFWMGVCAIGGFWLVLMTWYGVNFLLGQGLHSYGAGAGGLIWIVYYFIFEGLFFGYMMMRKSVFRRLPINI